MLNLSLSGCGFLGIYHIGVISAFREHAPEFLQGKISGCSAGALVAACAVCDCCLGQMVSDVLEIALKARSNALGPLHPSFSIVDILRNGLRRILPVDAHKICSGRVHVSLTRWKDGKNCLVNQFDSREELIQALICSSFIPCYSGFFPPKFKNTLYWDGGLSNNNPVLDQDTIIVSPFGGESDICPREESSSYYCYDFQGTNVQLSYENIYRISKALFPPSPEVLKAMCFRGYTDAISFLKSRNLLQCSCNRIFKDKASISSVIGEDLRQYTAMVNQSAIHNHDKIINEQTTSESNGYGGADVSRMDYDYDTDDDNIIQYQPSNQPLNYQEMPPTVCQILDAACDDNKGMFNYLIDSQLSRAISLMFLPWTLPVEFSFNFTKRVLELVPKFKVPSNSSNLIDSLLIYLNYLIQKFTYDRYQYHSRVSCKLCYTHTKHNQHNQHNQNSIQITVCNHSSSQTNSISSLSNGTQGGVLNTVNSLDAAKHNHSLSPMYYPKLCARHRVPSVCGSESGQQQLNNLRKSTRNRSYTSSTVASSVDLNEFKSSRSSYSRKRTKTSKSSNELTVPNHLRRNNTSQILNNSVSSSAFKPNNKLDKLLNIEELPLPNGTIMDPPDIIIDSSRADISHKSSKDGSPNRIHFHLDLDGANSTSATNSVVGSNFTDDAKEMKIHKIDSKNTLDILNNNSNTNSRKNIDMDAYFDNLALNADGKIYIG